jgi:hypothetical protein
MNLQFQNASHLNHNHVLAPINVELHENKPLRKPFVEANTVEVNLSHLQHDCIIPVFSKDNERTISHQEFINATKQAVKIAFATNLDLHEEIRVSHTVKGRTPSAIYKKASDLLEQEKTIYYERMAFAIEIPGFTRVIGGNELTLTVGGVRAYNQNNHFLSPRWFLDVNINFTISNYWTFIIHYDHNFDAFRPLPIDNYYYATTMGIQLKW